MAIITKKEAFASIKQRSRTVHGKTYNLFDVYLGVNDLTKRHERLYGATRAALLDKIDAFYDARHGVGDLATYLTPEQIVDAKRAFEMLKAAGIRSSLVDCVQNEINRSVSVSREKTLAEAYAEYLRAKADQSGDERNKTSSTVGRWVMRIGSDRLVSSITPQDMAEYLHTQFGGMAPRTFNAHLTYIRTFFLWCMKPVRGYCPTDPTESVDRRAVAWKKPKYLRPDDVKKLMDILEECRDKHPEWLALAVTQLFVGTRRIEAVRAKDSDAVTILLEDETFRVDKGKGYTKNKAPRTAHIEPNALAWMKSFDYFGALARIGRHTTDYLYEYARARGVPVFHNCMRHTFITMHVAKFHTPQVTQAMVGTSGAMRADHYDGLAPQKEGEAYFAIYPTRTA